MIPIRSSLEIRKIYDACKIVTKIFENIKKDIIPGVTTAQLDKKVEQFILNCGAKAAFKGYKGYPASICASVNEEVVHSIPSDRVLENGDILSIDVGVKFNGYFGDAAMTYPVGKITKEAKKLLAVTKRSLELGVAKTKRGNHLSDISYTIQKYVESKGFSVVRKFVGHGIGVKLHEEPEIPNFGFPGKGPLLEDGMVLAIEPMVNTGSFEVDVLSDKWTAVTRDRKLSAHFEYTVAIVDGEAEILTLI